MLSTILIVILVLFLVGALPNWSHSSSWGYGPSGGLGLGSVDNHLIRSMTDTRVTQAV